MNRLAVLIPSPGYVSPDVDITSGVSVDCVAWRQFLSSNTGGAWNDNEIITLQPNPNTKDIAAALTATQNFDYAFVAFSGHGKIEYDTKEQEWVTKVTINGRGDELPDWELRPRSQRGILSIDACRWDPTGQYLIKNASANDRRCFGESVENDRRIAHRRLFERTLLACEKGTIRMYACNYAEEASNERTRAGAPGGLFTFGCIETAKAWHDKTKTSSVLSLKDAFPAIRQYVTDINPQQTPQLMAGRRFGFFPLAVKSQNYR